MEYVPKTVKDSIAKQKSQGAYSEQDVLYAIKRGAGGIDQLRNKGSYHGDIRTDTVGVFPNGTIVLYDNMLINNQNCLQTRLKGNNKAIIPPEMYSQLKSKQQTFKGDWTKSDVYQMGIVALEMRKLGANTSHLVNSNTHDQDVDKLLNNS